MTATVQIINGQSCVVETGQPYIAPSPEQTIVDRQFGWNASAYSTIQRTGDCYVEFTVPAVVGVVVGFAPARIDNDPRNVRHGFYIYADAGRYYWSVTERGAAKTAPAQRIGTADVFRIERRGHVVSYLVNGAVIYTSALASLGPQVVVACLYASDDGVN